ncbi:MAG: D-alanine--D-alanine ligase [Candidatus Omnitrophota bacterium]|nr:D-alanine--D-alanine ligase [bacterium]MBU3929108.1 D-alanine--D-alanine ligase [bacterium]MBU4123187.1 D-alanine--D-alanine ligase [bacterium]
MEKFGFIRKNDGFNYLKEANMKMKKHFAPALKNIKKIAVLAGLSKSEREISLKTASAVNAALKRLAFKSRIVDIGRGDMVSKIKSARADFYFIACHGLWGEDGRLQSLLEIMALPYSGSGVLASAICMNKALAKTIFASQGIKTPPGIRIIRGEENIISAVSPLLPAVIKPSSEGSSEGLSIVSKSSLIKKALDKAFACGDEIVAEKYIKGREFTVGYLAGQDLPVLEIVPKNKYYDYEAKYAPGMSDHIVPARIDRKAAAALGRNTLKVCRALDIKGAARVDFIRSGAGIFYALEINTIPGMTETSLLPEAAAAVGISFDETVTAIIKDSLKR